MFGGTRLTKSSSNDYIFQALACGPVKSASDGTVEEVVAVGGYNGEVELGEYLSVVEIYNVAQNSWRTGERYANNMATIRGWDSKYAFQPRICLSGK